MDTVIIAALVAGAAGVLGAYIGQRRAHKSALVLFGLQATERAQIRAEETAERRETAFLTKRQEAYADLTSALWSYPHDLEERDEIVAEAKTARHRLQEGAEDDEHVVDLTTEALEAHETFVATRRKVMYAVELVHLLAPIDIAQAATKWATAVRRGAAEEKQDELEFRFLRLARIDVGADPQPLGLDPKDEGEEEGEDASGSERPPANS